MLDWPTPVLLLVGIGGSFVLILAMIPFLWRFVGREAGAAPTASPAATPSPARVPPDVRDEIDALGDADTAEDAAERLVARGPDVVPHLLAALPDTSDWTRMRLIEVLGRIGDLRAVATLEELIRRGSPGAGAAIAAVVSFGTQHAARVALSALEGAYEPALGESGSTTRHAVYRGVVAAAAAHRVSPAFRDALLAPLLGRVGEGRSPDRPDAAGAALALDPETAAAVLVAPEVLGRGADAVTSALSALSDAGRTIDAALAESLAASIPVRAPDGDAERATLHAVLHALAASGSPVARERIAAFASVPDEATRHVATGALAAALGIRDPEDVVLDQLATSGLDGLAPSHRTFHLVQSYIHATSHAEWFGSPEGALAAEVEARLLEIGATDAARILADARRAFARAAVSGGDLLWLDFDERLVAASHDAHHRLTEYVVAHAQDFRRG